jgi:hypothetical protein
MTEFSRLLVGPIYNVINDASRCAATMYLRDVRA